jgi:hypothetical protein
LSYEITAQTKRDFPKFEDVRSSITGWPASERPTCAPRRMIGLWGADRAERSLFVSRGSGDLSRRGTWSSCSARRSRAKSRVASSGRKSPMRRHMPRTRPGSSPGCVRRACWCDSGFSEIDPGQVTGYAIALAGHVGEDGGPLWYGAGRLAPQLTLPRLRTAWAHRSGEADWDLGTPWWAGSEREALYRHAGPPR